MPEEKNADLLRPYTKEEIFSALQQMHPCKAPGPDALIPKVKSPIVMSEFRPISLCNVLYKLVPKTIVLRLKHILPDIVTENQSAFVSGRLITDNALITLELFHTMKKRSRSRKGSIALKRDMSKVYDQVEWGFLRKLLLTMGFDGRWMNLVMNCVTTVSYSFIINGRVYGSVFPSRGIRQGDPLSPIWKKLQGWKEKLLSRAGKEILLIAVNQAIPTYLMGVYKLPASVTSSIRSTMEKFFWGQKDIKRKIHWKSWEVMSTPKCLDGMGFKDIEIFNDALLRNQAWRLTHMEDSLLSRVMKAKYYSNCSFLDSHLGYGGSYSWRSIWSSKALVKEGMIWRIGNGTLVNIWNDPWVADAEGRFITSEVSENISKVSDLVDFENMEEWNVNLIGSLFNKRDQNCILSIPLSSCAPGDVITWAFSKDGLYSAKTSYMLGKGCNFDTFHLALATGEEDAVCPRCGEEDESSSHVLFECERAKDLWDASGLVDLLEDRTGSILFNGRKTPTDVLMARLDRMIEEVGKYNAMVYNFLTPQAPKSKARWTAPLTGLTKLNER
ncbi:uncharacterized protein LOC110700199 [Chenopodium quinoa]|uniref:uncharacterized protein LOC110700199 n=1 Tax=Chenopodium quinoa TaxID=63459 RepID=UPI000B799A65|nr:uncharacterized protein LOC110700199 [Chenopodium quinoa]